MQILNLYPHLTPAGKPAGRACGGENHLTILDCKTKAMSQAYVGFIEMYPKFTLLFSRLYWDSFTLFQRNGIPPIILSYHLSQLQVAAKFGA